MTVVSITKAKIIKSIREEPMLRAGSWSMGFYNDLEKFNTDITGKNRNCSVCAVGSVMRQILAPETSWVDFTDAINASTEANSIAPEPGERWTLKSIKKGALKLVSEKRYINAISYLFEGMTDVYLQKYIIQTPLGASERARKPVIKFIEKHFPNKIKIDIDGAKPAKDIVVVEPAKKARTKAKAKRV